MRRMAVLAVLAFLAVAGCGGELVEAPSILGTTQEDGGGTRAAHYTCTHDVVARGADPTGKVPIDSVLKSIATPGATICFEPGVYLLGAFDSAANGLKLVGGNVRLKPTPRSGQSEWIVLRGSGWVFDGFEIDYRGVRFPPKIRVQGPDGWEFRNVVFRGLQDTGNGDGSFALLPAVTSAKGEGVIRNVYLHEGSALPGMRNNRGGIWAGSTNLGTLRIDGVWMEGFANNTIYIKSSPGRLIVENSYFRNSNVSGTRIGDGTVLRNNVYVKDGPIPTALFSGGSLMRGVWVESGGPGNVLIENCDFVFRDADRGRHPINVQEGIGRTTIRNSRIRLDYTIGKGGAIWVQKGTKLTLDGVHVTGRTKDAGIHVQAGTVAAASGCVDVAGPVSNRAEITQAMARTGCKVARDEPPMPLPPPLGTTPGPLPEKT